MRFSRPSPPDTCASTPPPATPRSPDRRAEPGPDDARGNEHLRRRAVGGVRDRPGPGRSEPHRGRAGGGRAPRRDRGRDPDPRARRPLRRRRAARRAPSPPAAARPARDAADAGPRRRSRLPAARSAVCFTGDLILGEGSSYVPPDGGSLVAYLDSLRRLEELDLELICPGPRTLGHRPGGASSPSISTTASTASASSSPRSTPASGRAPRCSTPPGTTSRPSCARRRRR